MILLQISGVETPEVVERVINRPLFTIGGTPVTPATLIVVAIIVVVTLGISFLLQRGTRRALTLRGKADESAVAVSVRLVHYVTLMLGFAIALQTVGVNLAALFTAGAFFAIALGFAMQNVAQNFVSGVILITERTIKPGDVLNVENTLVRVTKMGLRATVVRSRDEEDLIIPNSVLVQNTVTNYTLRDSVFRLKATVSVSYGSDMKLVMRVLNETAASFEPRLAAFEPLVLMTEFGDSGVYFEIFVWISDPWFARRMLSDLNQAIWFALKNNGVTIPFPQRDVHFYPAGPAGPDPSNQPAGS